MDFLFAMFKEKKSFYKLIIWNVILYSLAIIFYIQFPNMKNLNDFYNYGLTVSSRQTANNGAGIIVYYLGTIIFTAFTTMITYRRFKNEQENNSSNKKRSFFIFIIFFIATYTLVFLVLKIF